MQEGDSTSQEGLAAGHTQPHSDYFTAIQSFKTSLRVTTITDKGSGSLLKDREKREGKTASREPTTM